MAKETIKTVQMINGNNLTYAGFHFSKVGQTAEVTLAQAKHLLKKKVGNKKRFQLYDPDFDDSEEFDEVEDEDLEEVDETPAEEVVAKPMDMDIKSLKAWFRVTYPDIEFNKNATLSKMQALIPESAEEDEDEDAEDIEDATDVDATDVDD